jgi:hypothetical protein
VWLSGKSWKSDASRQGLGATGDVPWDSRRKKHTERALHAVVCRCPPLSSYNVEATHLLREDSIDSVFLVHFIEES